MSTDNDIFVSQTGELPRNWYLAGSVVFLDIDGVLANTRHREHYVAARPKNWIGFFSEMGKDSLHSEGRRLYRKLVDRGATIIYLTGRNEHYRTLTSEWLEDQGFSLEWDLVMRPAGFRMPLAQWKSEVLRMAVGKSNEAFIRPWWKDGYLLEGAATVGGEYVPAADSDVVIVDDDPLVTTTAHSQGFKVIQAGWQPKNSRLINTKMS